MNQLGFVRSAPIALRRMAAAKLPPAFADVEPATLQFWLNQHLAARAALLSGAPEVSLYRHEVRREVTYTPSRLAAIDQQIAGFRAALAPPAAQPAPGVVAAFAALNGRKFG